MSVRLLFLPRGDEPPRWWTVDDGRLLCEGAASQAQSDLRTVVVVPGEAVVCRWLELPGSRDAQAAAAAGFMLEGELAQPRESLHIAVGPVESDGRRLVVVADREQMRAWLEAAAATGADIAALTPDCLLLPDPEGDEIVAVALGDLRVVRGADLALTCESELLPVMLGGRPHRFVEGYADARAMLAAGAWRPLLDLRQGAFAARPARASGGYRLAALLALLVALTVPALPVARLVRYELAARSMLAEIDRLAGPASEDQPADPVERLRVRTQRAGAAAGFPAAATAIFAAVERVEGMEVRSLVYDEGGVFRLGAAHANYSDVELLRAGVAPAGLSVEETTAAEDASGIVSDLVLRPAS